ncbi:MAG: hypothetical protein QM676_14410 [Novosphingobium sp.]
MDDTRFDVILAGLAAILVALAAWLADRRRARRSDPDAVGFMPWTTLFFWAAFVGFLLLVAAATVV